MVDAQNKIQCKGGNHGSKELWQREARALETCLVHPAPSEPWPAHSVLSVLTALPDPPKHLKATSGPPRLQVI